MRQGFKDARCDIMGRYLIVREVEEYFYCPVVFYFSTVLGQGRFLGAWADLGKKIQEKVKEKIKKKFDVVEEEFEVVSERLRVRGKVDFLLEGNEPLEIKYSSNVKPWWKYTLVLYSVIIEDMFKKPVKEAWLYLSESSKIVKIKIYDEDRRYVEECVKRCHRILDRFEEPRPLRFRCSSCDYRDVCTHA